MLLKIDLEQDAELRNSIKNLVQSQVKAVVRDEIQAIVDQKVKSCLDELRDKKLDERIQDIIGPRWGGGNTLAKAFQEKVNHSVGIKIDELAKDLDKKEIMERVALQIAKRFNV